MNRSVTGNNNTNRYARSDLKTYKEKTKLGFVLEILSILLK
jgi:hypothetical protein